MRSTTAALIFTLSTAIHGTFSPAGAAPVNISPVSAFSTTEEGHAASFTVSLASQPLANVVIYLVSTDTGEGTVSPASLTFTPANWSSRTVSVTGQPDSLADGDVAYSIQTSLLSLDPQYALVNPPDVALVNFDEDADRDGDNLTDLEDPDDDGDGVDDLTEWDAPGDGDGNADGTPDSLQANVASLRSSTDKSFMTLEAAACSGGFFNVRALTEGVVGEADEDYDYPFGLVLFRLSCESAEVTLWFHGDDALDYEDAPYREHAVEEETGGWSQAATAHTANGLLRVELELEDGEDAGQERLGGLAVLSEAESSSERIDELFQPEVPASATAAPLIVGAHAVSNVTEETNGDVSLTYTVSLSNQGTASQPDNSGPEVITFLPPNSIVDLNSLSADKGTLSVVSQGGKDVALVWDLSLQATATATSSVTIVLPNDPIDGPPRLSARLQSSILMDIDGVAGNETLSLTDDPNQSKSVDPTPVSQ
jgi:hypothetical protein